MASSQFSGGLSALGSYVPAQFFRASVDGFWNPLQKNVTAGSAPGLVQTVNVANNQIVGYSYDASGNQTSVNVPGTGSVALQYDVESRITSIGVNLGNYAYNAQNQRVWRKATVSGQSVEQIFFYGADGKVMGTYGLTVTAPGNQQPALNLAVGVQSLYFAGRLIGRGNQLYTNSFQPISGDLVGTVRWDAAVAPNGVTEAFWPWGEERGTVTGNDRVKYGTYWRDSESSLDYAMNRYYSSVTGRFMSPDPYGGSAKAGNPQSWNRYAYVEGDPVNGGDPTGLDDAADGGDWFSNFLSGLGSGGAGGSTDGYGSTTPYDVGAVFTATGTASATSPSDGPTATVQFGGVVTSTVYAAGGGPGGATTSNGPTKPCTCFNATAFANTLDANANQTSQGLCGRYVGWGLSAGGANVGSHNGGAYGPYLVQAGFSSLSTVGYTPQTGDVAIFGSNSQHAFGHATGYDGQQWVSDYFQGQNPNPYRNQSSAGPLNIYRSGCQCHSQ